jgi:hypothetical protein
MSVRLKGAAGTDATRYVAEPVNTFDRVYVFNPTGDAMVWTTS